MNNAYMEDIMQYLMYIYIYIYTILLTPEKTETPTHASTTKQDSPVDPRPPYTSSTAPPPVPQSPSPLDEQFLGGLGLRV